MTATAVNAEIAIVTIVGGVTARAAAGYILWAGTLVATITAAIFMRTIELEIGTAVMIKAPQRPAIRAMALRTFQPHRIIVHIILLMAVYAAAVCLMKFEAIVTTLAGRNGMHAFQGHGSKLMVKARRLVPALGLVAVGTLLKFFGVMDIVSAMAGLAVAAQ